MLPLPAALHKLTNLTPVNEHMWHEAQVLRLVTIRTVSHFTTIVMNTQQSAAHTHADPNRTIDRLTPASQAADPRNGCVASPNAYLRASINLYPLSITNISFLLPSCLEPKNSTTTPPPQTNKHPLSHTTPPKRNARHHAPRRPPPPHRRHHRRPWPAPPHRRRRRRKQSPLPLPPFLSTTLIGAAVPTPPPAHGVPAPA